MTFIQANGKITSAAMDSTGAKLVKTNCPICSDMGQVHIQTRNGEIHLFPKYCPECGRKLHD